MCPTPLQAVASKPAMDTSVAAATPPAATPVLALPVHSAAGNNDHINLNHKPSEKGDEAPCTAVLATQTKQQPVAQLSSAPVALPATLPEQSNGLYNNTTLPAGMDANAEPSDRFSTGKLGKGEESALGLFAVLKPDVLKSLSVEQLEQQLISPDKFVSPLVTTHRPVMDIPTYASSLSSPSTSTSTPSPGFMGPFSGPTSRVESDGLLTRHLDGNNRVDYTLSGPIGSMSHSFPSTGGYALASPSTRAVDGEEEQLGVPGAMRRAHSAGDLRRSASGSFPQSYHHLPPGAKNATNGTDGNGKVGKLTLEERNMRISRYRQKRTARNFHKKITYVCRKTLADSRPRVRGRFACNDDDNLPMQKPEDDAKDASNAQLLADFDIGSDFDELDLEPLSPNAFHEFDIPDMQELGEGTFNPASEK